MSILRGKFKDNYSENEYVVDFHVGNTTDVTDITLGGTPVVIEQKSEGLFSPVKSRSVTVEIVSDEYIFDLYTPVARGIRCMIRDSVSEKVIFRGYVVPNVYDQTFTYLDTITIECVDALSTLKDYKYSVVGAAPVYRKAIDYISEFVSDCGYKKLYIPEVYDKLNGTANSTAIEDVMFSEANFFDDDAEHSAWTKYKILEEILQYLGLSITCYGDEVWCVNYRTNYTATIQGNSLNYLVYDFDENTIIHESNISKTIEIELGSPSTTADYASSFYAGGTSNLSLDSVYNKIEVNDNLYEVDEIAPDVFKEDIHISVNEEKNMGAGGSRWVKNIIHRHFLKENTTEEDVIGYQYQVFCRFNPNKCNWTHYYYRHNNLQSCDSYYDTLAPYSKFTQNVINKYINTHCCLIQHYAYRANNGSNNLPTSLDWEDYLTFFVTDDRSGSTTLSNLTKYEKKVLEYNIDEEVCWKPSSGTSWITIKGDLYYQFNGAKYGEKNKQTLTIITDKMYQSAPVEKCIDIDEQKYVSVYRTYNNHPQYYGTGFRTWKMGLHIGGKSWNGTSWVNDSSETVTFYINYNNNPDNRDDEYIAAFKWMSPVPRTDFTDRIGENAYCIPISATDSNAPAFGKMKLEIFTPSVISPDIASLWSSFFGDTVIDWSNAANVIYCKGFEVDYVYTDTQTWYSQKDSDSDDSDLVYTNLINAQYTNEFDSLEMKINTQHKDRPISRSYACTENGYVDSLHHVCDTDTDHSDGCEQEKNIIDLYYYHHSAPKQKYSCNIHPRMYESTDDTTHKFFSPHPIARYTFNTDDPINDDLDYPELGFVLDSYSFDLKKRNARLELVVY